MREFVESLRARPVIAAVRDMDSAKRAALSPAAAAFILGGSLLTLSEMCACLRDAGKRVFVHMDLCQGLGRDAAAVEWCARRARPDGLISTRAPLLRHASECGLITIQRLFVMDSASLRNGVRLLLADPPDMAEVLPGLLPKAVAYLHGVIGRPIIAGGMITEPGDVITALRAGALAVSTSTQSLWRYGEDSCL